MRRPANFDEAEELVRRANEEPFGLFAIQHPAPSVPSATSEAAADALTFTAEGKARRATQNMTILALLCSRESGYTRDELDAATNFGLGTICARVKWDLMPTYVAETDQTRPTRRRKPATVLVITDAGRARLRAAA